MYGILYFIILAVNLLLFGRIMWMAIGKITDAGVIGILKICIVSFILVCVNSLQVLFTDFFLHKYDTLGQALCVINSYQVLAITTIFARLTKTSCNDSLRTTIVLRRRQIMDCNSFL